MARSTYIYIIQVRGSQDIVLSGTVKHEVAAQCRRMGVTAETHQAHRVRDGIPTPAPQLLDVDDLLQA